MDHTDSRKDTAAASAVQIIPKSGAGSGTLATQALHEMHLLGATDCKHRCLKAVGPLGGVFCLHTRNQASEKRQGPEEQ